MRQFLKERWFLILLLIVFIILEVPHLHYPFFWDESWSYAPGVMLMYKHGPSLMPNAIDTFYSRGHPLFFYASAAAWMDIFGSSHIAQHAYSLFISVLLIISTYEICYKIFNKRVAVMSILFIAVQVMFFVQASFLLPEILVALLILLTLYFYVKRKYLFTFLACTALVFTKESGMVLGLVLGTHALGNLFNKKELIWDRLKRFSSIFFAGVAIGSFFLLQKHLEGWFFFPEHINMITWDWGQFIGKVKEFLSVIFFEDYRSHLFLLFLFLSLAAALNFRKIRYAAPIFPGIMIYILAQNSFPFIPDKLLFTFLMLSFVLAAYLFAVSDAEQNKTRSNFIYLGFAFIVLYLCFCGINFMTARYVMAAFIIVIMLTAYYFDVLINAYFSVMYYLVCFSILFIGLYAIKYDTGLGDLDRGAFNAMTVQADVVHYLEKKDAYDKPIACGSFQDREHLLKPYTGFLDSGHVFNDVKWDIDSSTVYVLFNNIEPDNRYDEIKNNSHFTMVYRATSKAAWMEVYKRKNAGNK